MADYFLWLEQEAEIERRRMDRERRERFLPWEPLEGTEETDEQDTPGMSQADGAV